MDMSDDILIIGNGFDKAHKLKTDYKDFLDWAYDNNKMGVYNGFNLSYYWRDLLNKKARRVVIGQETNSKVPNSVHYVFREADGWIELENNLSSLVETVAEKKSRHIDATFQLIYDEFLVKMFELYIVRAVNNDQIQEIFPFKEIGKVLSFNYSNTFERLYNANANICYVNGRATADSDDPHIVFGCDYYKYDRKDLTQFNKAVQRAVIGTDGQYRAWLVSGHTWEKVHIVGHSLGKTDWEIIRPFVIDHKTTVYYHSNESKRSLIHNMIGMVGKEFMISRGVDFKPISDLIIDKECTTV